MMMVMIVMVVMMMILEMRTCDERTMIIKMIILKMGDDNGDYIDDRDNDISIYLDSDGDYFDNSYHGDVLK